MSHEWERDVLLREAVGAPDEEVYKNLRKYRQWKIAKNGLTIFFEAGKYGVSDWGRRRGKWRMISLTEVKGVDYQGAERAHGQGGHGEEHQDQDRPEYQCWRAHDRAAMKRGLLRRGY